MAEVPKLLPPRSSRMDWTIQQADDAPFVFRAKTKAGAAIDLTDYICTLVAKAKHGDAARLFLITNDPALVADADAEFTVAPSGDENLVSAELPDEVTATFDFRRAVFDLKLRSPAGQTTRRIRGEIIVLPAV